MDSWIMQFYAGMEHQKLGKSSRVCELKESALSRHLVGTVNRKQKTRKLLLLP